MRCTHCGVCCRETEMLLSKADISRLETKGYPKNTFVHFDSSGYATLRNRRGLCVFYDAVERRCKVYPDRPEGCRIYPIIHHVGKGVVADTICHANKTLTSSEMRHKGSQVIELLERIDKEARNRTNKRASINF